MESLAERFHLEVFLPYLDLLKAQYRIHPKFDHARRVWTEGLTVQELVNGPYLERSQIYEAGDALDSLQLHSATITTIQSRLGGRPLYKHQTDALKLLLGGKNAVIATGTSSGKTLCYQIPILDDLLRHPSPGLHAIIIYPLNALVNDQLEEWERMLSDHTPIKFARFTGQTPNSQRDFVDRLKAAELENLADASLNQQQKQREVEQRVRAYLSDRKKNPLNRLNHREAIRSSPPQVLITNFSMLEYLMERPIDAPIFEGARLKFLVLDEAHAYRGVQATEIAFLIRRLKDRLRLEQLTCVATSATLGKPDDENSRIQVREFASELFDEEFAKPNPIYGTGAEPQLQELKFHPSVDQYLLAAKLVREGYHSDARDTLYPGSNATLAELLDGHDENLYSLRKDILTKPILLQEAAERLWPNNPRSSGALLALLEIAAAAKKDEAHDDLLPTRLHYFVRAEDGLHVCLHRYCPGRLDGKPAFFVSRKNANAQQGHCPKCSSVSRRSLLVELLTCRKCGYLFGGLQDLGPRRAQNPDSAEDSADIHFDSFTTELGWAGDSYWSYFSVDDELPYPNQPDVEDEDDDDGNLLFNPAQLDWCVVCGKKSDRGRGDNCRCEVPEIRRIKIFHRQCPSDDYRNLVAEKRLLTSCPNCGARNASGLEPLRRFQESDDETGLAMAIPLSHFQVTPPQPPGDLAPRKLLCFTDHRQRAAAFPSLLEEETFAHDLGRMIVRIVGSEGKPIDMVNLGERLSDIADPNSNDHNPDFFLPSSRFPDEELSLKEKRDLWVAEVFSYFGIPDSARESAEDIGVVAVEFRVDDAEVREFYDALSSATISVNESEPALQVLLSFIRRRKAFTLPKGRVHPDAAAFGRVTADISYALRRENQRNVHGWLPRLNQDGSYRDSNPVTDYLGRLLGVNPTDSCAAAQRVWEFLTSRSLLIESRGKWKLDHERLFVKKPSGRFVCDRCGFVAASSAKRCCPRKICTGMLAARSFDLREENIIARWVADVGEPHFTTLKSEEHTAQIHKDLAKKIEDEFRAEGVNLLSSTTTFEMGINIGDLQKVLLRNAPPTSASYVQRVGRAGRGKDKNAVCVTLCRRTKYDADAWRDPPRLMSGEIRTPTVFIRNHIIAQRHFNAVAFARFLRIKVADERTLGEVGQQIRLEAFLEQDSRAGIPEDWFQIRPSNLYLDFVEWTAGQLQGDLFKTRAGRSLIDAVAGFDQGRTEAIETYRDAVAGVASELSALVAEMDKLAKQRRYGDAAEIERSVRDLLGTDIIAVLAKRGFLPRYAFPLDVVTLETGWTRWSRAQDVELSRDRGIAIAEFAPGAQVIAHKRVFTSAGLYVVSKNDEPDRRWYSRCPACDQIRTSPTQEPLIVGCSVCGRSVTAQHVKPFVEPKAFSVRIEASRGRGERHRRSSLIRQRQSLTHFIDSVAEADFTDFGGFWVGLKESGKLFRYNLGPENKGFMLCKTCGHSEPIRSFRSKKRHKRLRPSSAGIECSNDLPWTKPLAYGHQFDSFCLVVRPLWPTRSVESVAFALQKGISRMLEIEPAEIGVSWRWLAKRGAPGSSAEIVLYDRTPGGAGFVAEAFNNWLRVVEEAVVVCNDCSCQAACYDCLKDYSNQAHHDALDRHAALAALTQSST